MFPTFPGFHAKDPRNIFQNEQSQLLEGSKIARLNASDHTGVTHRSVANVPPDRT